VWWRSLDVGRFSSRCDTSGFEGMLLCFMMQLPLDLHICVWWPAGRTVSGAGSTSQGCTLAWLGSQQGFVCSVSGSESVGSM
jgi:hypothetical protein